MRALTDRGFTLVELLICAAMVCALTATMLELQRQAHSAAAAVNDMADVQQRLRVAADALQHDLEIAGAGGDLPSAGALVQYLPPLRPFGGLTGETDTTYASDRITILSVPRTLAQAEVTGTMTSASAIPIGQAPTCVLSPVCGFEQGMHAIVLDSGGPGFGYELFTVADVVPGWLTPDGGLSRVYGAPAYVSEIIHHTYYLDRTDPAKVKLMRKEGRTAFPLVDGVADLRFTYYADPDPASVSTLRATSGTCVYTAGSPPRPLLAVLAGVSLAELSASDLTDGPFCGIPPYRFDADLLRIRRVRVTLRMAPSTSARRGAQAQPFEVSFDVTPGNLNLSR